MFNVHEKKQTKLKSTNRILADGVAVVPLVEKNDLNICVNKTNELVRLKRRKYVGFPSGIWFMLNEILFY